MKSAKVYIYTYIYILRFILSMHNISVLIQHFWSLFQAVIMSVVHMDIGEYIGSVNDDGVPLGSGALR